MTADECLSKFTPGIVRYVDRLLREGRVGMCSGVIRIIDVGTGCTSSMTGPCADRFKVVLPYAGRCVTWEVIFNSLYPDDPPDFIFSSDDDEDFMPDINGLPHLVNWQADRPDSLLLVLREILQQYKDHQKTLLHNHTRLQFEYSSLLQTPGYTQDGIEVHVGKRSEVLTIYSITPYNCFVCCHDVSKTRYGPVNFLIRLDIDFSEIPAYLTKENPGEDSAVLLVSFQSPDGGKAAPQLFLSPRVEHVLGGSVTLRIPAFPSGGYLLDYVPIVTDLLKNKIQQVVQSFEKRREYICAFISHFGRSLIEYDSEGFTKISFLMEWHDFFFVFSIELPLLFPLDRPTFTIQSVYHEDVHGDPYTWVVNDYPYSPRWSAQEMFSRAKKYILDNISDFQLGSVREGSFK